MTKMRHILCANAMLAAMAMAPGCGFPESQTHVNESPLHLADEDMLRRDEALPGSYLVMFRAEQSGLPDQYASFLAESRLHTTSLEQDYLSDPRVKEIRFLSTVNLSAAVGGHTTDQSADLGLPLAHWLEGGRDFREPVPGILAQVDFESSQAAADTLEEWRSIGRLWYAEPNFISRLSTQDEAPEENLFRKHAEDYGKFNYWWLKSINLTSALEAIANRDLSVAGTPTDADIKANAPIVAVLDSGVDYEHPALKSRIWTNQDLNTSGCSDDLHGCNTTSAKRGRLGTGDVWPYDADGPDQSCMGKDPNCTHGTHVAGIIAGDPTWAEPDSFRPAPGVCPVCQIMILKIVSKVGKDSGILDSAILAAFKYVTLRKRGSAPVRLINASFGKFVRSRSVGLLLRLMRDKTESLLIGAAGNEDTLTMEYPAAFKDAIAVAAVDSRLRKVSFSNFGRWVDIAAPGSGIVSTVPGGAIEAKSGTSMAAPVVAGVAGLMLARYPDISFGELRRWLLEGADPQFYSREHESGFNYHNYYWYPGLRDDNGPQPLLGYGLINAASSINRTTTLNLPVYPENNRVQPGCGVITPSGGESTTNLPVLVLLILMPALAGPLTAQSRQVILAMLRKRRSSPSRLAA